MKTFTIIIKEKLMEKPIMTTYIGDVTEKYLIKHYGLDQNDVEWYKIIEGGNE